MESMEEREQVRIKLGFRYSHCDPKLSVNNPSATEITVMCKVPAVRRSSPSIPSNTNGKYGGKGTGKD